MSDGQPRSEGGEFGEKISDQDVLLVFDAVTDPFLTTAEVAAELPVSRDAVYHRLERMHEAGLVEKKKAGARAVGWWAIVAPRLDSDLAADLDGEEEPAISHEDLVDELGVK